MYKAILFHPEGDYVTDYKNKETINEVWDKIASQGSRWIFYPIPFVAKNDTIVSTPKALEHMEGCKVKDVQQYIKQRWEEDADFICDTINEGAPLSFIY